VSFPSNNLYQPTEIPSQIRTGRSSYYSGFDDSMAQSPSCKSTGEGTMNHIHDTVMVAITQVCFGPYCDED